MNESGLLVRRLRLADRPRDDATGIAFVIPAAMFRSWLFWLALLVVPTAVGAGAAYLAASLMPPLYAAHSEVVFSVPQVAAVPEQYRATQVVVAASQSVLGPAAASLAMPVDALARNFTADFPKDGAVIRLQYADPERHRALRVLETIVDQYLLVLSELGTLDTATHKLLTPPFIVARPIWPQPLTTAAIGAALGLACALAAFAVVFHLRQGQ
jgi:hypothetical protein